MTGSDFQTYRIALITENFSGSNCVALYKYLASEQSIFDVLLVNRNRHFDSKVIEFINTSKILIYDSPYPTRFYKEQIVIQAWNGFSLKTAGVLDSDDLLKDDGNYVTQMLKVDIILSYSRTYRTFYNACFPTSCVKYRETGMPRNDFLFLSEKIAETNLRKIFDIPKISEKLILYMPANKLSRSRADYSQESHFSFMKDIFTKDFVEFLRENNAFLFLKLHPAEEKFFNTNSWMNFIAQISDKNPRIFLITDKDLQDNFIDLYEILTRFNLLITDYEPVAYDWLLTDKPLIHFIPKGDDYREKRNLLAEPLEFWLPGVTAKSLEELTMEIERCLSSNEYGREKRQRVKKIIHKFTDSSSCERVFKIIKEFLI